MLIDLTPAERKFIVSALKWSLREELNSIQGSANPSNCKEVDEEDREVGRIEKLYEKVIARIEYPEKRRKSPTKKV